MNEQEKNNLKGELLNDIQAVIASAITTAIASAIPEDKATRMRRINTLATLVTMVLVSGGSIAGLWVWGKGKALLELPQRIDVERTISDAAYVSKATHNADMKGIHGLLEESTRQRNTIETSIQAQAITLTRLDERVSGIKNTLDSIKRQPGK